MGPTGTVEDYGKQGAQFYTVAVRGLDKLAVGPPWETLGNVT